MAHKHRHTDSFGEIEYRDGALERLEESYDLLGNNRFAGSIYLAGRGVEAMLRAVVWKADPEFRLGKKSLETGHDLRELLSLVRNRGLLLPNEREDLLGTHIQNLGRLWYNNMRFACNRFIETRWRRLGEVHKRRTLKQASKRFHDSCTAGIKTCEALWRR